MKALTLWAPWADLVGLGQKRIETRSWWTTYRGSLLIHGGAAWGPAQRDLVRDPAFKRLLPEGYFPTLGRFICMVELVDVVKVPPEWVAGMVVGGRPVSKLEILVGDIRPGRCLWFMENVRPVERRQARGHQQLWDGPDDLGGAVVVAA